MFFKLEVSKMVMIPEAYGRKGLGYFKGPIKESGRVTLMADPLNKTLL